MRVLHTSDWHLGQRLHGKDRIEDHQFFLDWLIETINTEKVDLLIVAGDIFDIGYPPNSALKQYYRFLMELYKSYCKHVIIIGGNHDYISTLNAPKEILEVLNINIIGGATESIEDEIIEIKEDNEIKCVVCAVPFLRDKDIRKSVSGESNQDRVKAIKEGIKLHYQKLSQKVEIYKKQQIPIIATGHLYVNGSTLSDSERDIHIGNLGSVSSEIFGDIFDYVALGHIHKPQVIAGNPNIRYSGSPIPLSFSEKSDVKQVLLVDFCNEFIVNTIEIPTLRKMLRFNGTFHEVEIQLKAYQSENNIKNWAEVNIIEDVYSPQIMEKYDSLSELTDALEIIYSTLKFKDKTTGTYQLFEETTSLSDLNVKQVFEKMIENVELENSNDLLIAYNELVESINTEED